MPKRRVARRDVEQPLDSSYRLIPLTHEQTAMVDASDYEWLSQYSWFAVWNPHTKSWYARRTTERNAQGSQITIPMHREILGLPTGDPRKGDHRKPSQTLDNRRSNLRIASNRENSRNKRKRSDNTSGYIGVTAYGDAWRAQIELAGKAKTILIHSDKAECAKAYDEEALIQFGEFAHLNFPRLSPEL